MHGDPSIRAVHLRPTEATAISSLVDLLGLDPAKEAWRTACERAGVVPPVRDLSGLTPVAKVLASDDDPLVRVAGRSMVIRFTTYEALDEAGRL